MGLAARPQHCGHRQPPERAARRADRERPRRLRRGPARLERQRRPPAGAHRPLPRRRRRAAALDFARESGLALSVRGGGHSAPGYGTNDGGLVIDLSPMKGIHVDPVARTARAAGRRAVARARPRDAGVRPRHHRRHRLQHRHRRPDAGRRARLADGQARAHRRQPALRRRRDRRRRQFHTVDARREPRPVLGAAGRRRQLRHRHVLRVPAPPGRPRCSAGSWSTRCTRPATCCASTATSARRCPTRQRPTAGCSPTPEAGMPVVALLLGYNGPIDEGERVLAPARRVRPAARRPRGADAVRRAPDACSTSRTPSTACTATGARRSPSRSRRRPDRRHGRGRGELHLTAERPDLLLHARCRHPGARRRHRVRRPPAPVGLRCHRAVGGRRRVRPSTSPGCARSGAASNRTWRAAPTSTTSAADDGPRRCAPPTARTTSACGSLKAQYDPTNLFRINANIPPAG